MNFSCTLWNATIVGVVALLAVAVVAPVAGEDVETVEKNDETQTLQPVSEAPIKLVHVLNPGEREYLSPNLIGVQNIAMTFMPLTMTFINIIDAFREIVNGVRYEILLNANDAQADDVGIICRLVILEKPWLRTEWGDKVRELQYSNCTSEADNLTDPMAKNRALSDKYESNALFNGGTRNELSAYEMDKLAAQIMPYSAGSAGKNVSPTSSAGNIPITSTSRTTTTPTTESIASVVAATTPMPAAYEEVDLEPTGEPKELSDDEKKWLDDILSVGALNFEKSMQQNTENNDDETDVDNIATATTADEEINYQPQATARQNKVLLEDQQPVVLATEQVTSIK